MTQADYTAPVEILREAPGAAPTVSAGLDWPLILAAAGALVFSLLTVYFWLRSRESSDPEERAFRSMAARLGLSAQQQSLVRSMAEAHGSATPVSLLLSPATLAEVIRGEGQADAPPSRALLERLGHAPTDDTRERLELIA